MRTVDDIITDITRAATEADALATLKDVPQAILQKVADQLYIDPYGRSSAVVRKAIVAEARA